LFSAVAIDVARAEESVVTTADFVVAVVVAVDVAVEIVLLFVTGICLAVAEVVAVRVVS